VTSDAHPPPGHLAPPHVPISGWAPQAEIKKLTTQLASKAGDVQLGEGFKGSGKMDMIPIGNAARWCRRC
jgi:hypothetical protein